MGPDCYHHCSYYIRYALRKKEVHYNGGWAGRMIVNAKTLIPASKTAKQQLDHNVVEDCIILMKQRREFIRH